MMPRARFGQLTSLEGRQVSLALRNGDRIDDEDVTVPFEHAAFGDDLGRLLLAGGPVVH